MQQIMYGEFRKHEESEVLFWGILDKDVRKPNEPLATAHIIAPKGTVVMIIGYGRSIDDRIFFKCLARHCTDAFYIWAYNVTIISEEKAHDIDYFNE